MCDNVSPCSSDVTTRVRHNEACAVELLNRVLLYIQCGDPVEVNDLD